MRISTFFYIIRQGIVSIIRNKWFTLASVATISACIFLFGLFYAVLQNFQYMVKSAQEGVSVTVFFDERLSDNEIAAIGDAIKVRDEVAKINYISADDAWDSFKKDYFGEYEEQYSEGFTENPLADSSNYEIYVKDVSLQPALVTYLESMEGVRRVNRSEVTANTLTGVNAIIGYVSIGIIAILIAVSIFLISNTVTVGISIRRDEIQIMKYIGATDFFVRTPFVIEGMIIGLIGSIIPIGVLYFIYQSANEYVLERFASLTGLLNFLPVYTIFTTLIPISMAIGVGIGFIGSFSTVKKHLRV
ncbi:MAG: permease-like cell division protein FtsX [Eubacteriales bacterium]